ncbi:glycosyltransferase family 4 protein [Flavisericum labens]|uniref:glycosyltransferase family 4 protein n=1 Tax=Flavisericum labens TaxID=3377112 RepID=UPI00387ABFB0
MGFDATIHPSLLTEYKLLNKVIIENYNIPKNTSWRLLKGVLLLACNIKHLKFIKRFYNLHARFSLTWFYQWVFYKRFNDAAIVHVQYGTNKDPLDLLKKTGFFKPKLVVTFHGHDAFFPINGFIPNHGYYNDLFKYGNLITANTPYLGNEILKLGCLKEKLKIIPVAVNTSYFYPKDTLRKVETSLRLISVGRLDKVKGHSYAIKAVHDLINKGIDLTLTIIGDGAERNNLEKLIKTYGLEDKVFLLGKKSQEQVRDALWQHHVYLLTSVALPDGRRETQGLATLEAQACGLPAIVFDSGGVKYTVKDEVTGFICKEQDVVTLVQKIELLYSNRNLISKMGDNAIIFVNENYSQKMIDDKWRIIYNDLSNG